MLTKIPRVPRYRVHKSGQAFVQHKGRRYYLGKAGSTGSHDRYRRFIAELLAGSQPQAPGPDGNRPGEAVLVVQLLAAFWQFAEGYYVKDGRPSGHLHVIRAAIKVLRELYGDKPVDEFGPRALLTIQDQLARAGRTRNYINHQCGIIKRMFKWGVAKELVPAIVYHALATVPGLRKGRTEARDPEPVRPVPEAVIDATLPHLPTAVADMVRFQRLTGCRPGEVCQLRPCDVDRSGDVWLYRVPGHKTEHFGRERVVCIGLKAQEVLRPYLLRPGDAYCFSPAESEAERRVEMRDRRKTRVQPSQQSRRKKRPMRKPGDRYGKDAYNRAITRAVELANRKAAEEAARRGNDVPRLIPHWHPNQLRHSKATEVRRLFGLEAAQVTLGHAHARVTEVYAERDIKLAAEIARKIG